MNSLAENIKVLYDIKDNIKSSIENKGVVVGDVPFTEYPSKIDEITTGTLMQPNKDWKPRFGYYKFAGGGGLTLDCQSIYDLDYLFYCAYFVDSEVPKLINTSHLVSMDHIFYSCSNMIEAPYFSTEGMTIMNHSFYGCQQLETIPLYDMSNVVQAEHMMYGCYNLKNIGGFVNLKVNMDLSTSRYITRESMLNVIKYLVDDGYGHKLTIHQNVYDRLTEEDIAMATGKSWTIEVK